jgi:hypothetical protein
MGTEPTPPPPPHATATPDRLLGFVASSLAFAILLGVTVIGASLWVVVTLQAGKPPSEVPDTSGPAFTVLVGGTFLGAMTAVVATWTLLARVGSAYRRGSFAMVSAFATMVAMLVAIPAHTRFGPAGLVGLVGACALGCVLLGRRLSRWSRRHG